MRLIDADSLTQHMQRAYEKRICKWDLLCTVAVIGAEEEKEIVRCKDCKYRDNDYCKEHHDHIDREEFCSRGEAK